MPKKTHDHIGDKQVQTCGMEAEIIAYRSAVDIDVRFQDGTVVTGKRIAHFRRGNIANPNVSRHDHHIGERRKNTAGDWMELTEWYTCRNCLIVFDDGTETHATYDAFSHGNVKHPLADERRSSSMIGRTFETNIGLKATITAYRGKEDIDVTFENGLVGTHKSYNNLKNGQVAYDGYVKKASERVGEKGTHLKTGLQMEIIAARGCRCIDIRFSDGVVVKDAAYQDFRKGTVQHPAYPTKRTDRIGERGTSLAGLGMEVTAYRKSRDIDVRFDDGTERLHASYDDFLTGRVYPEWYDTSRTLRQERVGMHATNKQGFGMTITEYNNSGDMRVTFDDGTVSRKTRFRAFRKKAITYPVKDGYAGFTIRPAWTEDGTHYYTCTCKMCGIRDILTPAQMEKHQRTHSL